MNSARSLNSASFFNKNADKKKGVHIKLLKLKKTDKRINRALSFSIDPKIKIRRKPNSSRERLGLSYNQNIKQPLNLSLKNR